MRAALMVMAAALMAAGCGDDLPEGWEDAEKVAVTQSDCAGSPYGSDQASVSATPRYAGLEVLYSKAVIPCGQRIGALLKSSDGMVDLLFQPEMDPQVIPDCDHLYDLAASIDVASGAWEVRIWRRADSRKDAWLVGSQSVTVP